MVLLASANASPDAISSVTCGCHEFGEDGLDRFNIGSAEAEKIGIAEFASVVIEQLRNQHPALEDVIVAVSGLRQAEQQPFERQAHEQDVEAASLRARRVEPPLLDRSGAVLNWVSH
jgi:hypothetical protein